LPILPDTTPEDNRERYRAFARESPYLPLSFQPSFLDQVCAEGRWGVAMAERNGRVVGVWPWFLKRRFGLRVITMPMLCKWLGPWLMEGKETPERTEILRELLLGMPPADIVTIDCHPDQDHTHELELAGFTSSERSTYRLPLLPEEDLLTRINENTRRDIRKASQSLVVTVEPDPILFHEIHQKTYDRQGIRNPVPRDFLIHHLSMLDAEGRLRLSFARDSDGKAHSALALAWDGRTAYYHLAGNDHTAGPPSGNRLLVWDALGFSRDVLQLERFDFEGSMIDRISSVWVQMGAQAFSYRRVQYFRHRGMRSLYELLRG
jgi:hypothetical protein